MLAWRSRWMAGRAVLTTRTSSATMKKATEVRHSAQPADDRSDAIRKTPPGDIERRRPTAPLATARLTSPTPERDLDRQLSETFPGSTGQPSPQVGAQRRVVGGVDGSRPGGRSGSLVPGAVEEIGVGGVQGPIVPERSRGQHRFQDGEPRSRAIRHADRD